MRALVLCLILLPLILHASAARAQSCPAGIVDLTKQTLEIQVIPNSAPPTNAGGQVILGYYGCLRFNPGNNAMPYYTGQVNLLFFNTAHDFLTATGQQLWDTPDQNTRKAIPVQNPLHGNKDAHLFGSFWPVSYEVALNAISPLSVMELQITQCPTSDLSTCDATTTSTWLWTGRYFVPAANAPAPPHGLPNPPVDGLHHVSDLGPPCGATQPREGAAIAQATMVATDVIPAAAGGSGQPMQVLDPGYTSIDILGCLRFNAARPEKPDHTALYPYYGLGEAEALLFDTEGNVLTPIGNAPGSPYGQFISIFPASSAAGVNATDPTPILYPNGAGIHAFGFEYNFPLIAHGAISPYATLLLSVRGCTANVSGSCTGPIETFVHTVRTCFAELRRPLPHGGKPEDCPSAVQKPDR